MNHLTPHLDGGGEDAAMIGQSARAFFAATDIRALRACLGEPPGYRPTVWREMIGLGWAGWRAGPQADGSDLPFQAGLLIHEEAGAAAAPEPLLAVAVLAAGVLGRSRDPAHSAGTLARLVQGVDLVSLAWQTQHGTPIGGDGGVGVTAAVDDDAITLRGHLRFVPAPEADAFLVPAACARGQGIYLVRRETAGLTMDRVARIDGGFWGELRLTDVRLAPADQVIAPEDGAGVLAQVLDEGRLALAADMLGSMSEVFSRTLAYLRTRRQFGRTIAGFQALQHRAADLTVQIELTRAAVQAAARVFDSTDDPARRAAAASQAKARASAGAIAVLNGCLQLHGGIAYTEECDVGIYLKRAMVHAAWLGDAREHRRQAEALRRNLRHEGHQAARPAWLEDIRAWVERHLPTDMRFPPRRMSWRETHHWHQQLHRQGWVAPAWPREYGGMGLTPYEELLLHEVYDEFGINTFQNMGLTMLGPLLQRYGTDEQRRTHLPRILSGETYWCQGYSEPDAGSDLASLRTSAMVDGDDFVVNGQKIWTSLAHEADMMFLLARTDPQAKKQEGISFLLVDMKTPGITVSPIVNLTGARDFCSVFFDNVRVPRRNLVGELNQGWTMAKSVLGSERIMIGHPRFAKGALGMLRQLGAARGLADDPAWQITFDALAADVADLEALYVRYLDALREHKPLGVEVSLLKIWSSETWQRVVDTLRETAAEQGTVDVQEAVGDGLAVHTAFQFLHARPASIYGGTNEIQRNIVAGRLLELG